MFLAQLLHFEQALEQGVDLIVLLHRLQFKVMLRLQVRLLVFGAEHGHIERRGKSDYLNRIHFPKMTAVFVVLHAEHAAQRRLVEGDNVPPLEHERGHYLNIEIEDVLSLVSRQFD